MWREDGEDLDIGAERGAGMVSQSCVSYDMKDRA